MPWPRPNGAKAPRDPVRRRRIGVSGTRPIGIQAAMTLAAIVALSAFLGLAPPVPAALQSATPSAQNAPAPSGPGSPAQTPEDPTVPLTEHKAPPPQPAPQVAEPEPQPETPAP